MVRRGAAYDLVYSGADYTARYGMGQAVASSPLGPFTKVGTNPFVTDAAPVVSVGGGSVVTASEGDEWLVYFGREQRYDAPRLLRIDPLTPLAEGIFGPLVPTTTLQDRDPPETTITQAPPSLVRAGVTIVFAASEPATFACSLDGAPPGPCRSPLQIGRLASGAHVLTIAATDAAANADTTPAVVRWRVDAEPPRTAIAAGPPGVTRTGRARFALRADEAPVTFTCRLDRGAPRSCPATSTVTGLALGPHTLVARGTDAAGNLDPTGATWRWAVLGGTRGWALRVARRVVARTARVPLTVRCRRPCRGRVSAVAGATTQGHAGRPSVPLGAVGFARPGMVALPLTRAGRALLTTRRRLDVVFVARRAGRPVAAAAARLVAP